MRLVTEQERLQDVPALRVPACLQQSPDIAIDFASERAVGQRGDYIAPPLGDPHRPRDIAAHAREHGHVPYFICRVRLDKTRCFHSRYSGNEFALRYIAPPSLGTSERSLVGRLQPKAMVAVAAARTRASIFIAVTSPRICVHTPALVQAAQVRSYVPSSPPTRARTCKTAQTLSMAPVLSAGHAARPCAHYPRIIECSLLSFCLVATHPRRSQAANWSHPACPAFSVSRGRLVSRDRSAPLKGASTNLISAGVVTEIACGSFAPKAIACGRLPHLLVFGHQRKSPTCSTRKRKKSCIDVKITGQQERSAIPLGTSRGCE